MSDPTPFFESEPPPPAPTKRWAVVLGGVVDNVVEQIDQPDGGRELPNGSIAAPGWLWADGDATPTPAAADPRLYWIDVGPFKDRLGADGSAIAASIHAVCAVVREQLNGRKYVDLKGAAVGQMLDLLIATAQPAPLAFLPGSGPMTAAKKAIILNTPTTEAERHIKGLSA